MNVLAYLHAANLRQLLVNMRGIALDLGTNLKMMSLYLRTAAVLAAVALIFVGSGRGILLFMPVLAVYLLACALLSALSLWRQDPPSQQLNWAILDAVFVTVVLYEHILALKPRRTVTPGAGALKCLIWLLFPIFSRGHDRRRPRPSNPHSFSQ